MAWLSVTLPATADQADALSEALMSLGALSVSIEDMLAGTEQEQPVFGEPGCIDHLLWSENRLVALFEPSANVPAILAQAAQLTGFDLDSFHLAEIDDQDWVRATQANFTPIQVTARMWIVPSWHSAPDPQAINIQLDPGLAFGTGSHPTTRLCLNWLAQHLHGGETVLDYGCGSGILAIAAVKLGAGPVTGIDIDPQAIATALDNAQQNNVVIEFALPDSDPGRTYDVVVANILTNPLLALAPLLASRCTQGGRLVLSGILDSQADKVREAYQPWFDLAQQTEDDGWVCLSGLRS